MIKQFVSSHFCLSCLGCCRFKEKNSAWSPHLLKSEQALGEQAVENICDPQGEGFICASLDAKSRSCKIYQKRPFECQLYPFLINSNSGKFYMALDLGCPFAKDNFQGSLYNEYIKYLKDFFNAAQQKNVLKNNPQLIQSYENVKNVFELDISWWN